MEKVCIRCGTKKALAMFYPHSQMRDGRLNKCIECCKSDGRKNYHANVEQKKDYERNRRVRPQGHATVMSREHRERYPEKYKARNALNNAIRDGIITRQPCTICGQENAQAHHHDYSKPLAVTWYCATHHPRD